MLLPPSKMDIVFASVFAQHDRKLQQKILQQRQAAAGAGGAGGGGGGGGAPPVVAGVPRGLGGQGGDAAAHLMMGADAEADDAQLAAMMLG